MGGSGGGGDGGAYGGDGFGNGWGANSGVAGEGYAGQGGAAGLGAFSGDPSGTGQGGYAGPGATYGLGYMGGPAAAQGDAGKGGTFGLGQFSQQGVSGDILNSIVIPALATILGGPIGLALTGIHGASGKSFGSTTGGMDPSGNTGGYGGEPSPGGIPSAQPGAQTSPSSSGLDYSSLAQGLVNAKDPSGGYKRLGSDVMKDEGYLSMIRELAQGI